MKRFSTQKTKSRKILEKIGVAAFWLAVWFIAARIVHLEILLPSPVATGAKWISLMRTASYWTSIGASLLHILCGYLAGCLSGILLGFLMYRFSVINALFTPVLSMIRSVPVAAFIILALVWIGRQQIPPFIAFLMVFPVVSASVKTGLNSVNHELFEVAHVYHFTRLQTIRLLYQPAVLPHLITSARVTLGLAWKASVAAGILCSLSPSIGGNIYTSKLELETDTLFAWTITVILISILFEYLLSRALDALHPTARRNVSNVR